MRHSELGTNIHEINFPNFYNSPYYVKLRLGLKSLLKKAAEKYNIVLYTMGSKSYTDFVCRLIDPSGYLIKKIVSREDHFNRRGHLGKKSIRELVPLHESNSLIVDDISMVWEKPENVLQVPRYIFWPKIKNCVKDPIDSRREMYQEIFDINGKKIDHWSDVELLKKQSDFTLRNIKKILFSIHEIYYSNISTFYNAPRILDFLSSGVLKGCKIVFTGVIPFQKNPHTHPIWKLAERLGAHCTKKLENTTTHVIANKRVTYKVNQAKKSDLAICVHLNWLYQSSLQLTRANEKLFIFRNTHPPLYSYSSNELKIRCLRKLSRLNEMLDNYKFTALI